MNDAIHLEPVIEPELPIIDPHHHFWFFSQDALTALAARTEDGVRHLSQIYRRHPRYLFDELLADLTSGHRVRATVFVEAHAMYRADGPLTHRSVGEVEFANGMAAMAASGVFGDIRICAGIVGGVDLRLGDAAKGVIEAQQSAGGDRYRGIRASGVAHDANLPVVGGVPHVLLDAKFREGFKHLKRMGLSYDAFVFEPQLPDLIDLAQRFTDTQMILNHVGTPMGIGSYGGRREERFPVWRESIRQLSRCQNVAVKLGGLGMPWGGFPSLAAATPPSSAVLAEEWRPYIEVCIDAFGAERCMFESNFPVDALTASYRVLWNTFKRIASGASRDEKAKLFGGTAARIYRLNNHSEVA